MEIAMIVRTKEVVRRTVKRALILVVASFVCLSQAALAAEWPQVLTLFAGQSTVIDGGGAGRISVGDTEIVSTTMLESGEIILIAEEEGETNIIVWFDNGQRKTLPVVVVASNGWRESMEVKALLNDINGANVRTIGSRIIVDGQLDPSDLARVESLKERYDDILILARVKNEFEQSMLHFDVRITEVSRDVTEELGIDWSKGFAGPSLGYENIWGGDNLGTVSSANANASSPVANVIGAAMNPANLLGIIIPDPEKDLSVTQERQLARAQRRSYTNWGIGTSITSMINVLESNGAALTLTNPRLSARSGGKANLTVGGEVPVVTSSVSGQSVTYKDYGILLEVEPTLDQYDNITARISIEVSSLDLSNAVDGQPAFKKRSSTNDIKLMPGETLALAGLIQKDEQLAYSGIKWLADIPVLGNLFRSKSFTEGKTELVILITPTEITDPAAGENSVLVKRTKDIMDEFTTAKKSLKR
jgi:pilus assembly protein CpaC